MRTKTILILVTIVMYAVSQEAYAQSQTPGENTVAIGGHVGFLAIESDKDDVAANLDGFIEYYYTPRASIRAMYSWSEPELQATPKRTLRQQRVLVNFLYNWELGRFRPFATVGGGAYFLQRRENGESIGRRVTKPGGNIGWGVEYYLRTFALRTEMNVHILNKEDAPEFDGELSGFSWTFGFKVPF
jgi:hypothetical protein